MLLNFTKFIDLYNTLHNSTLLYKTTNIYKTFETIFCFVYTEQIKNVHNEPIVVKRYKVLPTHILHISTNPRNFAKLYKPLKTVQNFTQPYTFVLTNFKKLYKTIHIFTKPYKTLRNSTKFYKLYKKCTKLYNTFSKLYKALFNKKA
jgi:hypothetical protein